MVSLVARRWLGVGFGIPRLVSFFVINRASDRRSVIIPTQHAVFDLTSLLIHKFTRVRQLNVLRMDKVILASAQSGSLADIDATDKRRDHSVFRVSYWRLQTLRMELLLILAREAYELAILRQILCHTLLTPSSCLS